MVVMHREETATLWQLDFGNESIQIWLPTVLAAWLIIRHLGFDFFCFQLLKRRGRQPPKHPSICFPVSIPSTEVAGLLESLPAVPQSTWKNTHKCEKIMQTSQRQIPDPAIIPPFQSQCSEVVLLNAAPPY